MTGFGFVEFRDRRDADDVMHDFNNRDFMGERLVIEPARADRNRERGGGGGFGRRDDPRGGSGGRGRPPFGGSGSSSGAPLRTPFRVLVENLSSSVSWQDLKDFARRAGEVSFADAHKRRPGEGIVEFTDENGLRNALRKLDGEELRGRRIIIRESVPHGRRDGPPPMAPRERSYARRSRSRSPYRSPGAAPYQRRSSYRSRSPGRRRMSRSRSPYRSPGSRSISPRRNGADDALPPPPPHHHHSPPLSPRQPLSPRSPRSPSVELSGDHAGSTGDMAPADDDAGAGAAANEGWE
ncbi:RNA splicing [Coemansia sp. RSA 1804]|nr:RNA splicing [Coemansia sp. RSA 1804]